MLTTKSAHRKDITTGLADMQHRYFATIARRFMAEVFAERLGRTNRNFDRRRFLLACLGEGA